MSKMPKGHWEGKGHKRKFIRDEPEPSAPDVATLFGSDGSVVNVDLSGVMLKDDDWDVFRILKAERQQKRTNTLLRFQTEDGPRKITELTGLAVVRKAETHYHILDVGGFVVNYWPSSNKWQWAKDGKVNHGTFPSFINYLNKRKQQAPKERPQHEKEPSQRPADSADEQPPLGNEAEEDDGNPPW